MGGALFAEGEWESVTKMLSTEQDISFEHLPSQNSEQTENNLPDDHGLVNQLMGEPINPIVSLLQSPQMCSSDLSNDYVNMCNDLMHPSNMDDEMPCSWWFDYLVEDGLLMDSTPGGHHQLPPLKKRPRVTKKAGKRKKKTENSMGDDSNASQEVMNETPKGILNMNGKRRASRGAATDPQSLYARRRRERINERLRILQSLVPNGTKVDISTMLEEAVNYVKFLQVQIKLLSSDEMWMYAPLAYTGFDIGFYNTFSPCLLSPSHCGGDHPHCG